MNPQVNADISSSDGRSTRVMPAALYRVAKASTIAGLRLLSVLTGLAYVKYYTNALTVEQVGAFFYLGTLSYVLNALVFVPIDSYMQARISGVNYLPFGALKRLVGVTLLVAFGICLALSAPFVLMNRLDVRDVPLLYAMAALLYLCTSVRSLLNIRGHSMFAAGMIVFESAARLMAFVAVAWSLGASARTLLLSSIAALAAEWIILLWRAWKVLPLSTSSEPLDAPSKILRTASVLAGGAVSNTAQLQGYRVLFPMAGHTGTAAALGVTANIGAAAMSACSQVFSQLFLPGLYRSRGNSIGQYAGWGIAMSAAVLAVGLVLSDFLVLHLTRGAYLPYAPAVGVGIVIEASNMLTGAYGVYLTLHGRAGILAGFQLAGAIVSLAGCLILLACLPESPLLVGLVVAGSQILVTLALACYVHKPLRQHV